MTDRFVHALPFGATLLDPRHTRFRLWAPGQRRVGMAIDGATPVPLAAADGGWHEGVIACGAGARYHYVLEDGRRVPDPASRGQPDDAHGDSEVIDPAAYRWRHADWRGRPWHETVLYELHAGLCGGFAGVAERLAHCADLGVTAIELMPLAEFPGARNWGYDGVLPFAPESSYGGGAGLKALVDAAHGNDLMVFVDVVYNHFGPDGNDLHAYAPAFFADQRRTPWGPAIDFARPEVREFFIHNALYWLREYRVDGLRLDAVHAIDDPTFIDELAATVRRTIAAEEPGRIVHLTLENERNEAAHLERGFDAQWNDDWHNAAHVLLTGEHDGYYGTYARAPETHLARCLAEGFAWQGEPGADGRPRGTRSAHLPPTAFINFLQNHDQVGNRALGERLNVLAQPAALRAARVLQLLSPAIPLLFMGEEWGSRVPFLYFTDFHGELAAAVRDGRRREFARFPAFAGAAAARIPDPNAPETFASSRPDFEAAGAGAPRRCIEECRALLRLRHERIAPHAAGARSLGASAPAPAAVHARWRLGNGERLTLVANLGVAPVTIEPMASAPLHVTQPAIAGDLAAGRLPPHSAAAWLEPGND